MNPIETTIMCVTIMTLAPTVIYAIWVLYEKLKRRRF